MQFGEELLNRRLDEIIVRYQLHPELCDVYVEGEEDQGLVAWFLHQHGRHTVSVYPISAVTIPAAVVIGHGLEHPSNRNGVIALALELEANCGKDIRVTCIADSDFDFVTGITKSSDLLLYTDYTSIEMYAFTPTVVDKLIRLLAPRIQTTGSEALDRIQDTLQTFFALRLANKLLQFGLTWVDTEKCTVLTQGYPAFDIAEYSRRYLNTKGKRKDEETFNAQVIDIRNKFLSDVRCQIRGHDFVEMLTWYLRRRAQSCRRLTADSVKTLLLIQLSAQNLQQENMFRTLLLRTGKCA